MLCPVGVLYEEAASKYLEDVKPPFDTEACFQKNLV